MCTMLTPVIILNSSPVTWLGAPTPAEAMLILPGLALADGVRARDQEERVAVRRRPDDRLGADGAAGSGAVVDHERLAEPLLPPLRQRPRKNVAGAAGGKRHDDTHRPRGIGLRPSKAQDGRQRYSARGQMQKLSAGKFHVALPEQA